MKRSLPIIITTLLFNTGVNAQTFEWAKSFGNVNRDGGSVNIVDASGNVYTTGGFTGTVDFDPGSGIANHTSFGYFDAFVQKLDASGNFIWAKSFGGSVFDEYGISIAVDASGNVYTTGEFYGTVDFDPGSGTVYLTAPSVNGTPYANTYIQKLDASGNFVWAKSFGNLLSTVDVNSIVMDASGNLYTTGYFSGTVDFDPGSGVANHTSASGDAFVLKLNASGNFIWVKTTNCDSGSYVFGSSIAIDASGNVYTTGYFSGTADFDPGVSMTNLTTTFDANLNVQQIEFFVQKLDASGNFIWAKSFGGQTLGYRIPNVSVDVSGNVYTTGYFSGTADFDPGSGTDNLISLGGVDIFIQKLDASGNFIWANSFGNDTTVCTSTSNALDASGNVYTTGSFTGTIDFDPGLGVANLTSVGNSDTYVQKLDASGNFIWAKSFGSFLIDYGNSISVDASENVYTTGVFEGTVDFDPDSGAANLTSLGDRDVFIHKMSQGVTGVVEISDGIKIKSYPNPSKGLVHLSFDRVLNNVIIILTDFKGKEVLTKKFDVTKGESLEIEASPGVYFLSVKTPQGQGVVKLIIQ